jgi:hypothetical protein
MMPMQDSTVNEFVYSFRVSRTLGFDGATERGLGIYPTAVYNFSRHFCVEISDGCAAPAPLDKPATVLILKDKRPCALAGAQAVVVITETHR